MSDRKQEELSKLFDSLDQNKNGKVTIDEIKKHFEDLSDKSCQDMMEIWDKDGDQTITKQEFLSCFKKKSDGQKK